MTRDEMEARIWEAVKPTFNFDTGFTCHTPEEMIRRAFKAFFDCVDEGIDEKKPRRPARASRAGRSVSEVGADKGDPV